jgi:oligopeptide transport system substrate-binding protein
VEDLGAAWAEAENIVTNGPFMLESWRRRELLTFKRNQQYHGWFKGNVARVEITLLPVEDRIFIPDFFDAGALDIIKLRPYDFEELELIRLRCAGTFSTIPAAATSWLGFNVSRPPFDDIRVRRAFAHAVDRDALAEVTTVGQTSPGKGGLVPPGTPGYSPGIALPYDPERAGQLLAEAGYPGGAGFPELDALTPRGPRWESVNEYLHTQWRENLGVDLPWETVEFEVFLRRFFSHRGHLFRNVWVADYPDPDNFLRVFLQTRSAWRHPVYSELVERARRSLDQSERMRLYAQAERILAEEVPILPLAYESYHVLMKPWIRSFPASALKGEFWKDVIIEPH